MRGVEVVADDFVVVGFGASQEEATHDHDRNLRAFLTRCEDKGIKLNSEKMRLRMKEVPFIGHVATAEGLRVDPAKVQAILQMPPPSDVTAVQRLLGLAQYLSKFLPHLSDLTKPLRDLTQKETEWVWDHGQQQALEMLKRAATSAPVLRYYNLEEDVTLQCDASQSGLGAALPQSGQPVAYASRALTPTETRYAQIEKELLAIVFACNHFDAYVYGRALVNVETDHQPLESIVKKPLDKAPKRLQRMLLSLQKYSLQVKYKKGKHMYIADTLSRAHLEEVHVCQASRDFESVDHTAALSLTDDRIQQVAHVSAEDPVIQELRRVILQGWPETKSEVPEILHAYYDVRDELTVQDHLVFKGSRVLPSPLRKEMMVLVHATHIGVEGCIELEIHCIGLVWPQN